MLAMKLLAIFSVVGTIHASCDAKADKARYLGDDVEDDSRSRCLDDDETPFRKQAVCDIVSKLECDRCDRRYLCPCEGAACAGSFDLDDDWCEEVLGIDDDEDCVRDCVEYVESCCDYPEECDSESVLSTETKESVTEESTDSDDHKGAWSRIKNGESFDDVLGEEVCLHYKERGDVVLASSCQLYQESCSKRWRLRGDGLLSQLLKMRSCDNSDDRQRWEYTDDDQLENRESEKCLEASNECYSKGRSSGDCSSVDVVLRTCDDEEARQEWTFVEAKSGW